MQPALRALGDEISATIVRILAYVGAIAVLAAFAAKIFGMPAVNAAVDPTPKAEWLGVDRPYRAFALTVPAFAELEPDYAILRHATGGGRKDVMSWGDRASAGSRLMIEIYRPGKEIKRFGEAASEVVARTAELGGPYALKPAEAIASKFGGVTAFAFTARSGDRSRHCLGFARAFAEPRLQIAGWYCKGGTEVVDRGTLACALERLSLVMAASEPKVSELFAQAELKRKACGQKPMARAGNTGRNDWIAASKNPKLRGRVVTR